MTPAERRRMVQMVSSPEFERGFDRGLKMRAWISENKTTLLLGAVALGVLALHVHRKRSAPHQFSVSGVWTDLAKKLNVAVGTDLTVKEAQQYLNIINGKKSPNLGGTGLAEDGILGDKTSGAIRAFQAGNGLEQNGVIDEETGSALSYFVAAVSKSPEIRKMVTVTPKTIAQITPRASTAKRKPLLSAVDIGGGWVMYGSCGCKWDDAACAARCGGAQPTSAPPSMLEAQLRNTGGDVAASGDYRAGIQSTSMYSPESFYTDTFGAWVLPMSPEEWWCRWS